MIFERIDKIFNVAILNGGFNLPVATENVPHPVDDVAYMAAYLLPAPVQMATLGAGGCDRHTGIYQINLNYPVGQGVTTMKAKADAVNAVFKNGAVFTDGTVSVNISNVSIERVVVAGGFATLPITIQFWANSQRA